MNDIKNDEIRQAVREQYAKVAEDGSCGCSTSCCTPGSSGDGMSILLGYSADDTTAVPAGSDMGLGCGNPQVIANLKPGETVLDLGSGGGFDVFLAARQVQNHGHVIGVDMTPAMVTKARANAEAGGYRNVEFRLGEIEHLPVADSTVDVIISNCVINLSPDKPAVFADAFRVLKAGGRLAITDVVGSAAIPDELREDLALYTGCISGASMVDEIVAMLLMSGFEQVCVTPKDESKAFMESWAPGKGITDYVVSATIEAVKPVAAESTHTS